MRKFLIARKNIIQKGKEFISPLDVQRVVSQPPTASWSRPHHCHCPVLGEEKHAVIHTT